MRSIKFLTPFIFALLFSTEVMAGVGCKGLHNYLDLVLNQNKSASRALEVQTRINTLMAEGAEVSIESASGLKRVTVTGYENGELLYKAEGSEDVIKQAIDDDFNSFFKLADEISPTVADDLGDGARLTDAPVAAERTDDVPAASGRTDDVPTADRVAPELSLARTDGPDDVYVPIPPERSLVPVRTDVTVTPVRTDGAVVPVRGDGTAVVPVRTDTAIVPTGTDVVLRPTGTDVVIRPTGTDLVVRPGTDLAVISPVDDAVEVVETVVRTDVPRVTEVPALRLLTNANEVPENAIPILAKADFPDGAKGMDVVLKSPSGSTTYAGKIDDVFDHSIRIIKADGTKQNIPFRDLDANQVRFLNASGELGEPLELSMDIPRRWVPTEASFAGMEGKRVTIVINSSAGQVTHTGVIEDIRRGSIKLDSRENPLLFRRLDGASIEIVDEASTAIVPVRTTTVPARTTDDAAVVVGRTTDDAAIVPARTTDDAAIVPARTTDDPVVTLERTTDGVVTRGGGERVTPIDRVRLRRATTDIPAGRAIIDNDTGEIFEEVGTALIGNRRPSAEVARIRAVGGERLLDASDEFALALEDITGAAAEARRFADDVKLPATANDLLGAYRNQFVRIKIGEGDEVVEGVLKRIEGNKAILEVDGTVRRIDLPDFNPDRFVLGRVDDIGDSSVVFVDRAGNAVRQFNAIDSAGRIIPDDAVLAALNKGARFRQVVRRGADSFLEFVHNGKKIRIPRRILKRANIALRRNKAIIGDATFNFVRSGRSARALEETGGGDDSTPSGATVAPAGTERPETATTNEPPNDAGTTELETPYANGDDGGETNGETTSGNTDVPADPYQVDPNQSFFGAAKSLIKQGWTSLQGLW